MINLVIDGSFDEINLSVFEDKELVYDLFMFSTYTHSQIFVNTLDYVLSTMHIKIDNIDNLFCCIGPGRYTSLRVILSTIKGLFFNRLEYVYGFTTLDAVAASVCSSDYFRVVCETSKSKIYFADYQKKDNIIQRIGKIHTADDKSSACNSNLTIFENRQQSLAKNLFYIDKQHIKKIELNNLAPIY